MLDYIPKWHKELEIFSKVKPLIILEGNVLDSYQYPQEGSTPKGTVLRLPEYLHYFFKDLGYQNIAFYDSLRGFYNTNEVGYIDNFAKLVNLSPDNQGYIKSDFKGSKGIGNNNAPAIVRSALSQAKEPVVIVMDFASRYIASPDNMEQCEVDSFTVLQQASLESKEVKINGQKLQNLLVLIVNKVNDMPAWFYLQNPNVKTVNLSVPSKEEREALIKGDYFSSFFDSSVYMEDNAYYSEHTEELVKIQDKFVALTEGFSFTEINGLRKLCKNERIRMHDMCDVIDLYKYGIKENPWNDSELSEKIQNGKTEFEKRVKGQDYAITKTLDVIKRAITGMSGLQGSSHSRPKGVLFFAGPTGTGKTETAKALAEMIFGHDSCCIRFDMSEFSQSHSDQKLLGAPPGYVGYEAGGQLTNAVKKNPFSILLFDEIEKAHPSILDKFLQILEDGRMTDGQGNTVYFSETIIIFTSNLGIYTRDQRGVRQTNVTSDMPYSEMSKKVREAIENYFKLELGRPEILNRIGENIVVFDYIREEIAEKILTAQVEKICANLLSEKRIDVTLSDDAKRTLLNEAISNLANGGRGIGNVVESLFINPLARYLFDNNIKSDSKFIISGIDAHALPPILQCSAGDL